MLRVHLATFVSQPVVWGTSIFEVVATLGIIPLIVTFFIGVYHVYRHHECDVDTCHKIGLSVHNTSHRACKPHHPHFNGTITPEMIAHAALYGHNPGPDAPPFPGTAPALAPA
jgi:hypothetical protein